MTLKKTYRKLWLRPTTVALKQLARRLHGRHGFEWVDPDAAAMEIPNARSAAVIAKSILSEFQPRRVIHVGCGTGSLLAVLQNAKCSVFGLECSDAALLECRAKKLPVRKFDLQRDSFDPADRFDVVVSIGVAERLPESMSERYVDFLCGLGDRIVFSATSPGRGGTDAINEQLAGYWIGKFCNRGWFLEDGRSMQWRYDWKTTGVVERHYYESVMIFRRLG